MMVFAHIPKPLLITLSSLLIAMSCLVIWRSAKGFELASDYLGRKLPAGIKGATLNAIASSMPEFLTTMFFLFYLHDADGFAGGLGVSSGSALFNLLIIPAGAIIVVTSLSGKPTMKLKRPVLLREGLFLILAQVLFIVLLIDGELKGMEGGLLLLFYLAYLLLLFLISRSKDGSEPGFRASGIPKRSLLINSASLDIVPLVLNGRKLNTGRAWLLLIVSTLVMSAGTWLLVLGTESFGAATGIPLIFVAVVLSAAATSVPDTIISIRDARKANYDDAISNALGSNIFDIAFALGFPVLLYAVFNKDPIVLEGDLLEFTQEVWVFLLLATVAAVFIMLLGRKLRRLNAVLLLLIYGLFLLFIGTQVGGSGQVGGLLRDFLTGLAEMIGRLH